MIMVIRLGDPNESVRSNSNFHAKKSQSVTERTAEESGRSQSVLTSNFISAVKQALIAGEARAKTAKKITKYCTISPLLIFSIQNRDKGVANFLKR